MSDPRERRAREVLPACVRAMLDPAFYPTEPSEVELIQTHISYVFLAGDEVLKLKKPVRFSFLDFSTLERRLHYCHEEVRLNRRLAADVYLGVVSICATESGFRLGDVDDPAAVEFAVRMKRLPADRMFSEIIASGAATREHVDAIARRLVEFHAGADAGPEVAANGAPEALLAVVENDFSESRSYRGKTITVDDDRAIQGFIRSFIATHTELLRSRQQGQRIRECHGDLRAEHICFFEGLQMIDCIEFEPRFRYRDVAAEVAFLAMDVEHLGERGLAYELVERYAALAEDADLTFVVPFYQCYFAYIRGKVESLASLEVEVGEAGRKLSAERATSHFAQAYRYTWSDSPALIAVCGRSGSGKSTVAVALHERLGFSHFNSDVVRKEIAGLAPDRPAAPEVKEWLYSSELSERTYETMLARARIELERGRGAIVDATFQRRDHREQVRELARRTSKPVLFVECECSEPEIERRLEARTRSARGPSDADVSVYRRQAAHYESFSAPERQHWIAVDTTAPPADTVARIEAKLKR